MSTTARSESYIVAASMREAQREARNPYSRMTCDSREEADALAVRVNAADGTPGHYRVWVDVIEEAA